MLIFHKIISYRSVMDIFEGLLEFVAVARNESFTDAARSLGVSPSLVSKRVSALEERLGLQLVARTTRQVRLTDAGSEYFQYCAEMIEQLEEKNLRVTGKTAGLEGRVRISLAGNFAETYVVPAIADFLEAHPRLSVDIDFSTLPANFVEEGYDFAIRPASEVTGPSLVARKLADHRLVAAASPDYFERHGTPETPGDLRDHQCLVVTGYERWQFAASKGIEEVAVSGQWRSSDARTILVACRRGAGIAYMNRPAFGDALEDGSLITTLKPYWMPGRPSWIIYPSRKFLITRARRVVEFLLDRFRDWRET